MDWLEIGSKIFSDTSLGSLISLGGTALDVYGNIKTSKDLKKSGKDQAKLVKEAAANNAEISHYDAGVAMEAAQRLRIKSERDFSLQWQNLEKLLAGQSVAFAARGVRVGEGTPLDVMAETGRAGMTDAMIVYNENRTAAEREESLARRYNMLADKGLREASNEAYAIEDAANQKSENILWEAGSKGLAGIYDFGDKNNWWK